MKLHELIRSKRKELNLTQEQVANYLGVSAPAVNKWESGNSYPDIALLCPLARLLKTDVNTLLCFQEEITENDINQYVLEVSNEMHQTSYDTAYEKAAALIQQYPDSEKLILFLSQILSAYLDIYEVKNRSKYEKQILAWLQHVHRSQDHNLSDMAGVTLCQIAMKKEAYEEAQELLDQIPPLGYDKRTMQAVLYAKQGKKEECYEAYETMLYQTANFICSTVLNMLNQLCKEKEYEEAKIYAELASNLAKELQLGSYMVCSPKMLLAVELQQKEESLKMLEEMVDGIDSLLDTTKSPLYHHMKGKKNDSIGETKHLLKRSFETDETLKFIREDPRFQRMISKLDV